MKRAAPSRVGNVELHWCQSPPEQSPRCRWWVERIRGGWFRNRRLRAFGYYDSALYFGVYIWEWVNVLYPLLYELGQLEEFS